MSRSALDFSFITFFFLCGTEILQSRQENYISFDSVYIVIQISQIMFPQQC